MALSPEDMKKVGGSDVSAILGLSRYAGPLSVYGRIVDGIQKDDTPQMERGRLLEPVVLDWYERHHAGKLRRTVAWETGQPHLRASLDAVAWGHVDDAEWDTVVDAKTCDERGMADWGEEGTDQIPEEYLPQFHFYMGVTGRRRTDVPVLLASNFRLYRVEFDQDIYEAIRAGVDRFWRDHVEKRVPPEPTALSSDAEFIRKRFPRHKAKALGLRALSYEQVSVLDDHRNAVRERKLAESIEADAEVRVKLLLGEHESVTGFADGSRLTWRQDKPSLVVDWEAVARELVSRGISGDWSGPAVQDVVKHFTTTREGKRPLVWRERKKR